MKLIEQLDSMQVMITWSEALDRYYMLSPHQRKNLYVVLLHNWFQENFGKDITQLATRIPYSGESNGDSVQLSEKGLSPSARILIIKFVQAMTC